ncbi:MAG TPA: hypothetical protein VNE39_06415 [Planctomycetota bacterium]|nr:hypothetical protein [Planctomycetota bacterium]
MPSKYPTFDRQSLEILPLSQRVHDMDLSGVLPLGEAPEPFEHADLPALADAIAAARARSAAVVLLMGAHVIKQGLSRYVIDMIRRGWLSVVAMNGACAIHDFELARIGATTESVARYIAEGQFGLWAETGELNDVVRLGNAEGMGFGEALGAHVAAADNCPHKDVSIFAAAHECSVPATVHVGVGYDIVHEHPNFDPAAAGEASYRDFLIFAKVIEALEGGVVLCCGTAVMGPEVYLKALAMARNVARRDGREIRHFTSAVFDLLRLDRDIHTEAPKDSPEYYYRPYKTVLVRTVRDGGTSTYVRGDHRATIPALHRLCRERMPD